jgi:excisionase family DNA binding protein
MVTPKMLKLARRTADDLRQRGQVAEAKAIETLVEAVGDEQLPSLDLLTTTEVGDLLGVTGQTIKNWVRQGRLPAYRVGSRIMVSKYAVSDYVGRAESSLDLDEISDAKAARLVAQSRARS